MNLRRGPRRLASTMQRAEQLATVRAGKVGELRREFSQSPRAVVVDPAADEQAARWRHQIRGDKLVKQSRELAGRRFTRRRAVKDHLAIGSQKETVQFRYAP
jgi:hypothetical protein